MQNMAAGLPWLSLVIWAFLLLGRDGFWRARPVLAEERALPAWPDVVAVVPARNEAEHVGEALGSLLRQDYAGRLAIVLVDDHSEDATRAIAEGLARRPCAHPLEVTGAPPLPPGWSGKLWAIAAGLRRAEAVAPGARYLWLTDADIAHERATLARLVTLAEHERLDLVSLMARLRCASIWERLLVPAFVFFFQMLYPFAAVNHPGRRAAAAAGGCLLVRRDALGQAGGIEAVRSALIDDVALARAIKHRPGGGRIWLGLTRTTRSLRPYRTLGSLWGMVARTADTQLRHSLLLLCGTVTGMALTFLVPPLALLLWPVHGEVAAALAGGGVWLLMAAAYRPMVRLYQLAPWWLPGLPLAALLFVLMTMDSALRHRLGRGGRWKGRLAPAPPAQGRSEQ